MAETSSREEELLVERDLRRNGFPRSYRVRTSREFRAVFKNGRKVITDVLVFHVMVSELDESRLGLAVSKKVGNAVIRNKVKRRIREAFRLRCGSIPSNYDFVVYPRRGILDKNFEDYLHAFDTLISRIKKRQKRH